MSATTVDTLIIGCGIAGAAAALKLSEDPRRRITVITRAPDVADSNSAWAQGGIVTRGLDDDPDLLIEDILEAGAGLSSAEAALILATDGPRLVQKILIEQCGVQFDRDPNGELTYGLEGAHSRRRVVHVGDKTGAAIMAELLKKMMAAPNIEFLSNHTAVDLMTTEDGGLPTCAGAILLDREADNVVAISAGHTILATGGVGQIYWRTTNPPGARGDGIAMAWRAGLMMQNMAFVQFHPTAMAVDQDPLPLVSEAVRGEGARLVTPTGTPFMPYYAPDWLDLAPRDVVARAIYTEMQENDYQHVYLDLQDCCPLSSIAERFPTLVENCQFGGIDPHRELIPVVPAAHYFCGGIPVDGWGKTLLQGLFAIGEVSCTGVHGANRLASTSLLEGLVWGHRAAEYILHEPLMQTPVAMMPPAKAKEAAVPSRQIDALCAQLQSLMWDKVGIIRTDKGLISACHELEQLADHVEHLYTTHRWNDALIGLRNAVQTGRLITEAALATTESVGAHYRNATPVLKRVIV